ncbi:MAG: hypothetical protein LUE98_10255 [Tannerellaceae bacterium]|nr:hypothetical protein [Tannerellaceae bacterium]
MNRRVFLLAFASLFTFYKSTGQISTPLQEKGSTGFPLLFHEERDGTKIYLHSLTRKMYNELTDNFYVPIAGKRHWIGPEDIFLEYEMEEVFPVNPQTGVSKGKNVYRRMVWYRPENNSYQVALKILYDWYETESGEHFNQPDQWWRIVGPVDNLRQFRDLLDLWKDMTGNDSAPSLQQVAYPLLFERDDQGNKSEIYHLERKKRSDLSIPFMMLYDTPREFQPDDLILEYEILDHFAQKEDSPDHAIGNLFRCQVCFTNNGGTNSRVFIRILSDIFWSTDNQWQEDPDNSWREAGYLDEIRRFQQLLNAYRTYVEPLDSK